MIKVEKAAARKRKFRLSSIRWQLAARFTMSTIATMFVILIGIAVFIFSRILFTNWRLSPGEWLAVAERTALPYTRKILEESPDNNDLIDLWLTIVGSPVSHHRLLKIGEAEIYMRLVRPSSVMLVDADGIILGFNSGAYDGGDLTGQSFREPDPMNNSRTIEYILAGGNEPVRFVGRHSDGESFIITLPVMSDTETAELLGVLSVSFDQQYTGSDVAVYTAGTVSAAIGILLFFTAAVALLFAFFTARALTGRLQRFTFMAEKWSRGDFSSFIEDEKSDEIGALAERFDLMAARTAALMKSQKRTAVAAERQRMAMELHDSVKQQALAASLQLGTAMQILNKNPGPDHSSAFLHLSKTESLLDSVRSELTEIVDSMFEPETEKGGFQESIERLLDDWSGQNDVFLERDIQISDGIPPYLQQAVYRVLQEALSNIFRHSRADRVGIECRRESEKLVLKIRDNGCGFSLSEGSTGKGLYSMRNRAESNGGSFSIESTESMGTQIAAEFFIGETDAD